MSKLDAIYRSFLLSKYFVKGWGNPNTLKKLFEFRKIISDRNRCQNLVSHDHPVHIDKEFVESDCRVLEGHFVTPVSNYLPEILPKECENAYFQVILPKKWTTKLRPICLHLAGTGDHRFWRRKMLMARPLLKDAGIASILLENPFYGLRKPKTQRRSSLNNVSDLFVMGMCLVLESLVLLHWSERQGLGPLGITGFSMGGHMASIAGSNWPKPLALIPCLSWTTASCAFTNGVMREAIPWNLLESQYLADHVYQDEIKKMIHSPEQNLNVDLMNDGSFAKRIGNIDGTELMPNGLDGVEFTKCQNSASSQSGSNSIDAAGSRNVAKSTKFLKLFQPRRKNDRMFARNETLQFMKGIMDECTHIGNFSTPVDPSLCLVIAAKSDGYIPRDGLKQITDYWPGAEVRYVDCGHIAAFLLYQGAFRKAIKDAFDKTIQKYY